IFISKLLGLLYVIPLNAIAGADNMQYYGFAYEIYSYILNVSIAGIPYAIATLVAKYSNIGDYRTTLVIKRIAQGLMVALGFIGMSFLFATPLASIVLGVNSSPESLQITRNVIVLISFALFFVPVLSAFRGFYQGLKEMEIYAFSQVLEQLSRVMFLLGAGAIAVYVFKQDRIWAVYFAVFSTSVAAICALVHIFIFDKKNMPEIKRLANEQEVYSVDDHKLLFKELVRIAIPYLLVAIVGFSNNMIDWLFYTKALEATGVAADLCNYIFGSIISVQVNKVTSIPQILAPGFSISIIPYITVSVIDRKWKELRRHVYDCVDSVLYLAIPLSFCLLFFSRPIMYLLYGESLVTYPGAGNVMLITSSLELGGVLLKWHTIDALFGTLTPIFTSLLMAVGLRKQNFINLIIGAAVKLVFEIPCIHFFGMQGASISNLLSMLTIILLDAYFLKRNYKVQWKYTIRKMVLMMLGVAGMALLCLVFNFIGFNAVGHGRLLCVLILGIQGLLSVGAYLAITAFLQLPQTIFKIDINKMMKRLVRRG
ncbi:polysaccharide biosynthesis C-terminal domain-containing protein, partial [Dielma fastidiosa]|uniref:oligosaccharide flippase family protein n=1 Tax=Dielma fastidiosa TaxID=1034346 RepID=UPI0023F0B922